MSLIVNTAPPMPKAPKPLTFPRLMQSLNTGIVFLITRIDAPRSMAEGVALYHAPPRTDGPPWLAAPGTPVGEWGGNLKSENLKDYDRVLSLQNDD